MKINSPIVVPWAAVTVLFRPLPWEAHNGQELANTAESCFLIVLAYKSRKRLRSIPRELRNSPYIAYCLGFTAMFVFAFSSFANFGILARQRTQTMPLVLTFLCLPVFVPGWKKQWSSESGGGGNGEAPGAGDGDGNRPDPTNPYARFLPTDEREAAAPSDTPADP